MNLFVIDGNLGADPVFRTTANGTDMCTFSIANKYGYGDKERISWFSCKAWTHTAKYISGYAKKGDLVVLTGMMIQETWDDKNGVKHSQISFNVNECRIMRKAETREETKPEASGNPFDDSEIPSW